MKDSGLKKNSMVTVGLWYSYKNKEEHRDTKTHVQSTNKEH